MSTATARLCDADHAATAAYTCAVLDLALCEHHARKHREALNSYVNSLVDREYQELTERSMSVATVAGS